MGVTGFAIMKTERAKVHLDALHHQIRLIDESHRPTATENYIRHGRYIRRTKFPWLPADLGMLLGEFLYCLRSGLDQMAWQLASAQAKVAAKSYKRVAFPIFESISNRQDRENWKKAIAVFPGPVAAVIETFQPFKGPSSPKDHFLWQLNELCNIDKHRIIPVHSRGASVFIPTNPNVRVQHFQDADIIEVSVPLSDMNQMQFKTDPALAIEIGEWESDFSIPLSRLAEIHEIVRNQLIPKFSGFVPESPRTRIPAMRVSDRVPVYKR
jgi:hypothetical protein